MRAVAIVPAAGRGVRMGSMGPKVLMPLLGRPLLGWTLRPILESGCFSEVAVACSPDHRNLISRFLSEEAGTGTPVRVIIGGQTRQDSVANCLREISSGCDLVAVHDGARPLVTAGLITTVVKRAEEGGAAIAAVPCKDTVKLSTQGGIVSETLDRSRIWLVQTPQCFRFDLLVSAYEAARRKEYVATDDSSLVEHMGAPVHIVMGSYENIKVTTPEDLLICEEILKRRVR
ncbi:2-C-methyl-D-erythritol 4-phosphate cytidylyltransferase [Candidatus Poribacteria bacterium]|nr:2-C-methyl-D-erythritol 4-phosphate cytidylyltransferase [Candidatus Poribacteria bacterium]